MSYCLVRLMGLTLSMQNNATSISGIVKPVTKDPPRLSQLPLGPVITRTVAYPVHPLRKSPEKITGRLPSFLPGAFESLRGWCL